MFDKRTFLASVIVLCAFTAYVRAQLPSTTLSALHPPGGKIGSTFDVSITASTSAEGAEHLFFSHPGIKAVPKSETSILFPGTQDVLPGQFTVTVGSDVAPGIYEVWLAGPLGVSNPRGFAIEKWNEVIESGVNQNAEKAQMIEVGSVVSGKMDASSEDWFRFAAKKGTRVLVDVLAPPAMSMLTDVLWIDSI